MGNLSWTPLLLEKENFKINNVHITKKKKVLSVSGEEWIIIQI